MKRHIPQLKVQDLAIAVVPRSEAIGDEIELWDVYVINLREEPIRNVLISSRGYGILSGKKRKTTTLRHYFEQIEGQTIVQIEPIQIKLFSLTNEYWVSFVHADHMYDKKYTFVPGSIQPDLFTSIPLLNQRGVMIR